MDTFPSFRTFLLSLSPYKQARWQRHVFLNVQAKAYPLFLSFKNEWDVDMWRPSYQGERDDHDSCYKTKFRLSLFVAQFAFLSFDNLFVVHYIICTFSLIFFKHIQLLPIPFL